MAIADLEKARRCLARVGYYRLSAYWYPFRLSWTLPHSGPGKPSKHVLDSFVVGTELDEVIDFYVFDKELRLLATDALERIEIGLRAQIANHLGSIAPKAHRDASLLDGKFRTETSRRAQNKTRHQDWLETLDRKFALSKEDFAEHFRLRYPTEHPPIWVATEVWDWGMLSHFVDGMKHSDKDAIAAFYGHIGGRELVSWVHLLNDVRNICAHHSRLWNRGLKVQPRMPSIGAIPEIEHIRNNTHAQTRLYAALVVMCIMMKALHPTTEWHLRIKKLLSSAPKNPIIGWQTAGVPADWQEQDIWT